MPPEYEPLLDVRKDLKIDWYRSPIDKKVMRELMKKSDLQGLFQAGGHLAIFAGTGMLSYTFFMQEWWIACILAVIAHGTVGTFFSGLATHELSHGTVFRTRWLNKVFMYIFSLLGWLNFHNYNFSHTYHHQYTLHPRGDREVVLPQPVSLRWTRLLQLFTLQIFDGPVVSGMIPVIKQTLKNAMGQYPDEWVAAVYEAHGPEYMKKSINLARLILLFHLGILVVSIYFQLWILPILLSFHLFFGNWLKYFIGLPMHCGLRSNVSDFRKCTRSIKLDPLSEFLYWRMNWHTEHHMYAGVPCYNLKKLHEAIAHDMPQPKNVFGAWREMREIWRRQQEDPSYEYDTPVPSPADRKSVEEDSKLAASIGDLAPKPLA